MLFLFNFKAMASLLHLKGVEKALPANFTVFVKPLKSMS